MPVETRSSLPVLGHSHHDALDHLSRAFAEARPVSILISEWDSGASYLIDDFVADLGGDVAVVRITKPCSDPIAGMREVISAIGFNSEKTSLADLENDLTAFLSAQRDNHRRTIICFEETQDQAWWVLERVRRLVELEAKEQFGLMVILSVRPSLSEFLSEPPFDVICVHAGQRIALAPFTLVETTEYISREIEAAGIPDIGQVIELDAITLIHELCEGVPDSIDSLCCACIQLTSEEDTAPVTTDLVRKVNKQLQQEPMTQQLDAEARPERVIGASISMGRLIARMNGVVVQEQILNHRNILIGRGSQCDIPVTGRMVSRLHALVVSSTTGASLVDLGSTNGTFVDGRQIEQCTLRNGDVITVGDCTIAYVAGDA
jgi:type II secretory pathway predicted ATPase ExeA